MTPDAATVIAYSAGLFALIFVFFLLSSRGKPEQAWYGLPFAFGSLAAILLVHPAVLPGLWSGRLAIFCILLAYGAAWQVARVTSGRPSRCYSPRSLLARRGSASPPRSCTIFKAGLRLSLPLRSHF